jgi:antitoxin YefM
MRKQGSASAAQISAERLAGAKETAYLLQSPANAKRLLTALRRTKGRKGKISTVEQLRRELGLGVAK